MLTNHIQHYNYLYLDHEDLNLGPLYHYHYHRVMAVHKMILLDTLHDQDTHRNHYHLDCHTLLLHHHHPK